MLPWERKAVIVNVVIGILLVGAVLKAGMFIDETKYEQGNHYSTDAYILRTLSVRPEPKKHHRRKHGME